jgi:hypothetical protein
VSGEDGRIVFRTSQPDEVPAIAERLVAANIPFEIRVAVQEERETEAIALIEAYMSSIGAAPTAEPPSPAEGESLLSCPNCEAPGIALRRPCSGCGFSISELSSEPPLVSDNASGARSFCPECRDPLTFAAGACPRCHAELEPLESGDRLCPEKRAHVLYRDTVGGAVCKACHAVWVDLA